MQRVCPQCGAETTWSDNPHRPFCSERCRLIDLEGWLGERYAIPGDKLIDSESVEDRGDGVAPVAGQGRAQLQGRTVSGSKLPQARRRFGG